MKGFTRKNLLFSLCGLNCGLCSMKLDGYCPGCGGGAGNQTCVIARCSLAHGGIEYCWQCEGFPCDRYRQPAEYDVFITSQNRRADLERSKELGIDAYTEIQRKKAEILKKLLCEYNDGRRKTFFCLAANLLELEDLTTAARRLDEYERSGERAQKERAVYAAELLQDIAEQRDITLKLRKKPKQN